MHVPLVPNPVTNVRESFITKSARILMFCACSMWGAAKLQYRGWRCFSVCTYEPFMTKLRFWACEANSAKNIVTLQSWSFLFSWSFMRRLPWGSLLVFTQQFASFWRGFFRMFTLRGMSFKKIRRFLIIFARFFCNILIYVHSRPTPLQHKPRLSPPSTFSLARLRKWW